MTKAPPPRAHQNQLPDFVGGGVGGPLPPELARLFAEARDQIVGALPGAADPHWPTPYVGASGIALALWRLGRQKDAYHIIMSTLDRWGEHHVQKVGKSLLCGHAGLLYIASLITADDKEERERHIGQFELLQDVVHHPEDEFLYGNAGYLWGALRLAAAFPGSLPASVGARCADQLLASGRTLAAERRLELAGLCACGGGVPPLMWAWHGSLYVGAAHGMMGILYMLLHQPTVLGDARAMADVRATLDFVLRLEEGGHYPTSLGRDGGRKELVHWCHGAPGAVYLFARAAEVAGGEGHLDAQLGPTYLDAAVRAGEAVWELGLLRKGPGLCHGVSGNGYALLRLHRATGDARWLERARQFGAFLCSPAGRADWNTPDHPYSLFEGLAGAACFLDDLLGPGPGAGFPLFDL